MDNYNPDEDDLTILPVKTDKSGLKLRKPIHPNLPNIQDGSVCLLIMPKHQGKSGIISNLLLNPNMLKAEDNLDYVFIISNTIEQDLTSRHLKNKYKATCFSKYDDNIINDIIKFANSFRDDDKKRMGIILDDCLGSIPKNSIINYLSSRSRHILGGGLLCFSSQTIKSISPVARVNADYIILGTTNNEKEREKIYDEWGQIYGSKDKFYKAWDYATSEKYNYFILNMGGFTPKMYKNFTEDITNKFIGENDIEENDIEEHEEDSE